MRTPHYQFFLALEHEFEESIRYLELDTRNGNAFSTAYLKMLFGACVEIEAVLKELIQRNPAAPSPSNINQLRIGVLGVYPKFFEIEVQIPRYSLTYKPWSTWGAGTNPDWWRAYNATKHNRGGSYEHANQKNVAEALAALFAAIVYLYAADTPRVALDIEPKLFHYDNLFPAHIVMNSKLNLPQ